MGFVGPLKYEPTPSLLGYSNGVGALTGLPIGDAFLPCLMDKLMEERVNVLLPF